MKTIKLNVEKYFNIKYKISFVLLNCSKCDQKFKG